MKQKFHLKIEVIKIIKVLDEVTTNKSSGWNSRGDHYDWCRLLSNDTLEFGNEQGNYAGGITLSYRWYGCCNNYYNEDHIPTDIYWNSVAQKLEYYQKENGQFYSKIFEMCKRNKSSVFSKLYVIKNVTEQ